jgi:hypothetical protein
MLMYFVPKPCKGCFGSSPAALSGPVPKAPALPGDTYSMSMGTDANLKQRLDAPRATFPSEAIPVPLTAR